MRGSARHPVNDKVNMTMNSPKTPVAPVRLTSFSHVGGCGCKVAPGLLT